MQPLDQQIQQANEYYETAKSAFAQGCDAMILCGLQLLELKTQVKHGDWEILFDGGSKRVKRKPSEGNGKLACHFNFSRETARKCVVLAREAVERSAKLKSLLGNGAGMSSAEWVREAVAEVRSLVGPANYLQLSGEWGLTKPPGQVGGDLTPRDADGKRITRSAQELADEKIWLADETVKNLAVSMLVLHDEPECRTLCLASPATRKILRDAIIDLRQKLDQVKEPK